MNLKNKNVLVYGLSISGEWVAKLLIKKKAKVFLFDDEKKKKTAVPNTYIINELNTDLICRFDFIVLSPSIPKTFRTLMKLDLQDHSAEPIVQFTMKTVTTQDLS